MKPLTIALSLAALALPLLAQTEDSPLVRAAKATGRLNKKPGVVITNDTLLLSGGHLATTDVTTAYPKAGPPPTVVSPYAAIPQAKATPQVQAPGSGVNSQPPAAVNSQPPTAMNSQPLTAQTTPVTGVSTTSAVSYTSTTQPMVAPVKPPQP
jgi:hypothetical protein